MSARLSEQEKDGIHLASGSAHPELASQIANEMGVSLRPVDARRFPNTERYVRFDESVRGEHVFIVQPHISTPDMSVNDAAMELCLMVDAARSSSAREVTAVIPYLGYARSDRKARGRESLGIRVVIDQLAAVGVKRIVTVDMHSPASQAVFRGPFDHLTAQPTLRAAVRTEVAELPPEQCAIVAPDFGAFKSAHRHQEELAFSGVLTMPKSRSKTNSSEITRGQTSGSPEGLACVMFDDMIDTAGTLVSAANVLHDNGAKRIIVAATHGVLSSPALERLRDSPIDRVLVTDSHRTEAAQEALGDKLRVISIAPMIGQALIEIVQYGSISRIFADQNHL